MKNLARHIELLLRNNDCVILPGFGGFIAHNVPAYYVSEEGLYYPPSRSISFNASITMNDGLLAQSYMKSYQVDYARANYMIDVAVEQLIDILDEEGTVTLTHIGTLTQDINQSLQFVADEAGIASPLHFGLGSFLIRELAHLVETTRKVEPTITHTTKTISLHIRKDVLHRIVSTAAVFLLLLMVALPTGDHQPTDIAALHLTEIIATPQAQAVDAIATPCDTAIVALPVTEESITPIAEAEVAPVADMQFKAVAIVETPAEVIAEEPIVEQVPIAESVEPATTPVVETTAEAVAEVSVEDHAPVVSAVSEKTYHIIVASLPNHRGTDEALNQYTRMGYTGASLVERDDRVRISLMQFADKTEANAQLAILRQQDKFKSAWLLAVRN